MWTQWQRLFVLFAALSVLLSCEALVNQCVLPTTPSYDMTAAYMSGQKTFRLTTETGGIQLKFSQFSEDVNFQKVAFWNSAAVDASGIDHTPPESGDTRKWKEQFGPHRASRAMAIIHIAMFDAANAILGGYTPYCPTLPSASPNASVIAAVSQAAHDTLSALYTAQAATFDAKLTTILSSIAAGSAKDDGIAIGKAAAACILALRQNDNSDIPEPTIGKEYNCSDQPGKWRIDPIGKNPTALGAFWGRVKPFTLTSSDQFRVPPCPALSSLEYHHCYEETHTYGGDGVITKTERTPEQELIGLFWAYDGTPSLCAPPRMYNQILTHLGVTRHVAYYDLLRLYAIANTAMADAAIASWESKFYHDVWRPITAMREAAKGTGPTGLGDGNPLNVPDPTFTPYGIPSGRLTYPHETPPFPSYPSGHATFGGALFQVLRNFFGTDYVPFTFISDELNGKTVGRINGTMEVRPLVPRTFNSFTQAEQENAQSRIYLGIHWQFDKTAGIAQGNQIADWTLSHYFLPKH